jgi:hypothetical protein
MSHVNAELETNVLEISSVSIIGDEVNIRPDDGDQGDL